MDSESESLNSRKNISLAINLIDAKNLELNSESLKDLPEREKLQNLLQKLNDDDDPNAETLDELTTLIRSQLKSLGTVGQILDFLSVSIKLLFIKNSTTSSNVLISDIFAMLPSSWESDPVKVHLITKNIYETLKGDFNNLHHVIATIICINNKLAFYVSLTIFWALFNVFFKKDSIHYFKMYSTDKFFKLLLNNEPFNDSQDADSMFKLLLLISIYQNHVLLNKETPDTHQVFQEFFKSSQKDREKLKTWLINVKTLIEVNNPLGKSNQSADVLMLLEFLELDLIRGISQDDSSNHQSVAENLKGISHAVDEA